MQAIILAAGMGKRLGELTKNNTKCMVQVNGGSLIERLLRQLDRVAETRGLSRIVIVVGYEGKKLQEYIATLGIKTPVEFVDNPIYDTTNNIYSLYLAKDQLQEDDTLLFESDLIFEDSLIEELLASPSPNLALVAKYETWMDGTMVCIDDECNIVNFITKEAFRYAEVDNYYKTVNVYKFSKEFARGKYVPFLKAYTQAVGNNEYYENVLRIITFLSSQELKALPTAGTWYEIDDKQDLDIAEALFADEAHLLKKYYGRYGGFWRFPKMLDFCYLVNPYFRRSKIMDEMEANFRTLVAEYPSGMQVNSLLASKCWGVKEEYIIPGNGAAELIKALTETITGTVGVVRPTFEEYPNRLPEDKVVAFVPQNRDFRYSAADLIAYFGEHHVDNLLLINPDNPSGNFIPKEDVCTLAAWCEQQGTRLVLDESFVDFSEDWRTASFLDNALLERHPHLVVVKSISKSYGVPGLRLGILAAADAALIAGLKKRVSIWNINSFAEFFMQIYTKHEKAYHHACDLFLQARRDFEAQLREIPYLHVMPSQANFFFAEVLPPHKPSELVLRMLKEHNILLSACSAKKGIEPNKYIRIAIRNHGDNERLIAALKSL